MALLARPIQYIVSGLPTPNGATVGRRPLTPRTTTQVRPFGQLLDKRTGALLERRSSNAILEIQNTLHRRSLSLGILELISTFSIT